ncbi:competence type IV pilus minor pilin ComGD [Listeria sp. PSOL-1]|uniref:competence type IV pilus minor pilin ComGD n=1 Tax=Listeria sp. PSOL-1 TaxID=1844999 RepID=UPI0013CFBD81|nr:competence type IV pilus minor pilin ComGD [Listeria sp. PSOL-1]
MFKKVKPNGFSLIEILFVLTIFMLLIRITLFPIGKLLDNQQERNFFRELQTTIYTVQMAAITSNENSTLSFTSESITMKSANQQPIHMNYPKNLHFKEAQDETFKFHASTGHINKFKTVTLYGKGYDYQIIFQIGKGRFRIAKQN